MIRVLDALYRRLARWTGFRCYVILLQPLTVSLGVHAIPDELEIREASLHQLRSALEDPELRIDEEFLQGAEQRGDRCFAAFDNKKIVAYTWRARQWAPHEGVGVVAAKPYVYGYKGMTRPEWRGRRLNAIVNHSANKIYLDEGYSHMVTFTSVVNRDSRRAMTASSGYEFIGRIVYLPVGGALLQYRSAAVRATGLRFGANSPHSNGSS